MKVKKDIFSYDLVGNRTRRTVDGGATADDFYANETGSHPPVSGKLPPDVIRRNGRITVFHRNGAEREHHG